MTRGPATGRGFLKTGSPATGRAFLKTGSLLGTCALAGYVHAGGTVYAVKVLVNHPEAARAAPALDRMNEWVAARGVSGG